MINTPRHATLTSGPILYFFVLRIHRLAQRWGLTKKNNNVVKTERDLKQIFPENRWNKLHLQIIFYGREFCSARGCRGIKCEICTTCYPNRKRPYD